MNNAIVALEAQVRADLAKTAHPGAAWLALKQAPDERPALDVLVVGAGQSGLATAFGLMRSQVTNILVLDKSEEGQEGPWLTYARMHTLRSPKEFTGPDLDIPSLTYQSWHEARFGEDDWRNLDLIPRELWAEYLLWFRRVVGLPVRNGCEVVEISPAAGGLLAAKVQTAVGIDMVFARKIVLATGQEGMGDWTIPEPLRHLPSSLCAHTALPVDFASLRGKQVAVIGAGASAFDNAATALEAGAAEGHLFCRRSEIQVIQPYRWLTFRGFLRHFCDLDDAWRWRFLRAILEMREGFPQETYDRCARHANFHRHDSAPIEAARETGHGVELQTPRGVFPADFVICGTGIDMNFAGRRELKNCAANIAVWADRYQPPADERSPRLGRYPYLADDYALMGRVAGETPWISDIHVFAIASTMSFGPSGSRSMR
jgi:FAD-dependent urate hydroxylase